MIRTKPKNGFTLIEVLIAVSLASILTLGIGHLLNTALTSWRLAIEEVTTSKLAETLMRAMTEGDYDYPGIRDAVDLVELEEDRIAFVPLWMDVYRDIERGQKIYLKKALDPNAAAPLTEIKFPTGKQFRSYYGTVMKDKKGRAWIEFGFPLEKGSTVRAVYQPDTIEHPELVMTYGWDKRKGLLSRYYNDERHDLNAREKNIRLTDLHFTYLDGVNQVVDLSDRRLKKASLLSRVSAVRVKLSLEGQDLKHDAVSMVNIRALGKGGQGIPLSEGLEIPIPDSEHIQLMQLINFANLKEGQVIELKISQFRKRKAWRLKMTYGVEFEKPVLRDFQIYYPESKLVEEYGTMIELPGGVDLLSLSLDGNYDYDLDDEALDQVEFTGDKITLEVLRADVEGVRLVVRP